LRAKSPPGLRASSVVRGRTLGIIGIIGNA